MGLVSSVFPPCQRMKGKFEDNDECCVFLVLYHGKISKAEEASISVPCWSLFEVVLVGHLQTSGFSCATGKGKQESSKGDSEVNTSSCRCRHRIHSVILAL